MVLFRLLARNPPHYFNIKGLEQRVHAVRDDLYDPVFGVFARTGSGSDFVAILQNQSVGGPPWLAVSKHSLDASHCLFVSAPSSHLGRFRLVLMGLNTNTAEAPRVCVIIYGSV